MTTSGFVAGTLVHTDKGLVPIEQLKIGDLVLSRPDNDPQAPNQYKVSVQRPHPFLSLFKHRP
jgi:hypothetical protein